MFAPLLGVLRADIDQQVGWAKREVRRQVRHTALIAILAGVAALATLGAIVVALTALQSWLAMQTGPFVAHGIIGGGLPLVVLSLFALAFIRRRPRPVARPQLQMARSATLLGTLGQGDYGKVVAGGEQTLKTRMLRNGSRSTPLGALAIAVVVALMVGRGLSRGPPVVR